jgi:hypothetical protein
MAVSGGGAATCSSTLWARPGQEGDGRGGLGLGRLVGGWLVGQCCCVCGWGVFESLFDIIGKTFEHKEGQYLDSEPPVPPFFAGSVVLRPLPPSSVFPCFQSSPAPGPSRRVPSPRAFRPIIFVGKTRGGVEPGLAIFCGVEKGTAYSSVQIVTTRWGRASLMCCLSGFCLLGRSLAQTSS